MAAGTVTAAGNYTFNLTFTPFTISSGTFTVATALTNEAATAYTTSSVANGRFSLGANPTVGTSTGFVWSDANLDGTFTGAEQTRFSSTQANIRFSITAAAVPEPSTNAALLGGGAALLLGWHFRRRRAMARI